jgi:hypothetical protein
MAEWDKSRWYVMSELLDELLAADVVTLNPCGPAACDGTKPLCDADGWRRCSGARCCDSFTLVECTRRAAKGRSGYLQQYLIHANID